MLNTYGINYHDRESSSTIRILNDETVLVISNYTRMVIRVASGKKLSIFCNRKMDVLIGIVHSTFYGMRFQYNIDIIILDATDQYSHVDVYLAKEVTAAISVLMNLNLTTSLRVQYNNKVVDGATPLEVSDLNNYQYTVEKNALLYVESFNWDTQLQLE